MSHFQHLESEAAKTERISDDEARQIVELWSHGQTERRRKAAQATVADIAEGLDAPPEEVLALLRTVRARKATEAAPRRRWSRLAAAAVAIMGLLILWILARLIAAHVGGPPASVVTVETADAPLDVGAQGTRYQRRADGSVILDTPEGHYERRADGSLLVTTSQGRFERSADGSVEIRGPDGYYLRRADGSEERNGTPPRIEAPSPPPGVSLPEEPFAAP
jgi:hypothetical protein